MPFRRVPDIRSIIVNLDRYHTTNRLAARANENGPVTGGCPISSMVTVNIHGQHLDISGTKLLIFQNRVYLCCKKSCQQQK